MTRQPKSPAPAARERTADPVENPPRRLLGFPFWALLAFSLVCILSGAVIGVFGPALFPAKPVPGASTRSVPSP
jgi:hypothetical protein